MIELIDDDLKCYLNKNRRKSSGEPKVKANPLNLCSSLHAMRVK